MKLQTGSLKGDVNKDGKITVTDLLVIKRQIVKLKSLNEEEIKRADTNGDGKITVTDLLYVKRVIIGL
ncbi:MAG: dockerin type I repeat-containing protein [Clostridia bacterium]|nr:dockerin type I repeat-containing protein [Clostridia bacterium]